MRNGSFVKIIDGPYKDRYGKVLSIDGDLGSCFLKAATLLMPITGKP